MKDLFKKTTLKNVEISRLTEASGLKYVSPAMVHNIKSGKVKQPGYDIIITLMIVLGVKELKVGKGVIKVEV